MAVPGGVSLYTVDETTGISLGEMEIIDGVEQGAMENSSPFPGEGLTPSPGQVHQGGSDEEGLTPSPGLGHQGRSDGVLPLSSRRCQLSLLVDLHDPVKMSGLVGSILTEEPLGFRCDLEYVFKYSDYAKFRLEDKTVKNFRSFSKKENAFLTHWLKYTENDSSYYGDEPDPSLQVSDTSESSIPGTSFYSDLVLSFKALLLCTGEDDPKGDRARLLARTMYAMQRQVFVLLDYNSFVTVMYNDPLSVFTWLGASLDVPPRHTDNQHLGAPTRARAAPLEPLSPLLYPKFSPDLPSECRHSYSCLLQEKRFFPYGSLTRVFCDQHNLIRNFEQFNKELVKHHGFGFKDEDFYRLIDYLSRAYISFDFIRCTHSLFSGQDKEHFSTFGGFCGMTEAFIADMMATIQEFANYVGEIHLLNIMARIADELESAQLVIPQKFTEETLARFYCTDLSLNFFPILKSLKRSLTGVGPFMADLPCSHDIKFLPDVHGGAAENTVLNTRVAHYLVSPVPRACEDTSSYGTPSEDTPPKRLSPTDSAKSHPLFGYFVHSFLRTQAPACRPALREGVLAPPRFSFSEPMQPVLSSRPLVH